MVKFENYCPEMSTLKLLQMRSIKQKNLQKVFEFLLKISNPNNLKPIIVNLLNFNYLCQQNY